MTPDILKDPVALYYIAAIISIWPLVRIFRRAGFSPVPIVFLVVPFLGYLIALGTLVFRKWPVLQGQKP